MPEEFMFMFMPMLFMPMPMFMFMLTEGAVTGRATGMDVCAGLFSAIGAMDILALAGRLAAVATGRGGAESVRAGGILLEGHGEGLSHHALALDHVETRAERVEVGDAGDPPRGVRSRHRRITDGGS